ncbi:hypothetical protein GINT2_000853 [Glugoides intestinalis]
MLDEGSATQLSNIIQITPETCLEITESHYDKFIIKFSADNCPSCENLQRFLDKNTLSLKAQLPIYKVDVKDTKVPVYNDLRMFFKFRSLPHIVVTNNSLEELDKISGFSNIDTFKAFIEKNFG